MTPRLVTHRTLGLVNLTTSIDANSYLEFQVVFKDRIKDVFFMNKEQVEELIKDLNSKIHLIK